MAAKAAVMQCHEVKLQMLRDLANDYGCVAIKWAAEDREVWRQERKDVSYLLCSRRLLMMMIPISTLG